MDSRPLPLGSGIEQYQQHATQLIEGHRSADAEALREIRDNHPRFASLSESAIGKALFVSDDAQLAVARSYDFASWAQLAAWVEAVRREGSPTWQFEWAVESVITGDVDALARLLRENPELVNARSTRSHHATLLVYVGANGVEGYRQKTPKNAAQVAALLLDAGAEIDAVGEMYGGTTALGLVATSVHPVLTGVQAELMQLLLDRGASMDRAVAPTYRSGLVVSACLANGRPGAAEFLAQRGARLDLEAAAGVGRLDIVQVYFDEMGGLAGGATEAQKQAGFEWACAYGRRSVVDFLLAHGVDAVGKHGGATALHSAAYGGHPDIVKQILDRGAQVDVKDEHYGGTPLGWAMHGWMHPSPDAPQAQYHEVVTLLVGAGSKVEREWLLDEKVRADPRVLAALAAVPERRR